MVFADFTGATGLETRDLRRDRPSRGRQRSAVSGAAGAIGFIGNERAALIRLRAVKRPDSPALVADGYHAHTDGLVSLGVVGSAIVACFELGDPLIGLAITVTILGITWQSWQTIRAFCERARRDRLHASTCKSDGAPL